MENKGKSLRNSLVSLAVVLFVLVLSAGFASANTLVGGTIYQVSPDHPVPGISIHVQCDSEYLDTTSLSDGTYAVVFDKESCSVVDATANGEGNEAMQVTVHIKDDTPETPADTGKGKTTSGRVYLCGNGLCDSGETSNTCIRDCPLPVESKSISQGTSGSSENTTPAPQETIAVDQTAEVSGSPGITGAVTGTVGGLNLWLIITIALLLLVIIFLVIKRVLTKNKASEYK